MAEKQKLNPRKTWRARVPNPPRPKGKAKPVNSPEPIQAESEEVSNAQET